MKTEEIQTLFEQFEKAAVTVENVECWSARELQPLLGYAKWENFSKVIEKAKESCGKWDILLPTIFLTSGKRYSCRKAEGADLRVCPSKDGPACLPPIGKRADT